MSTKLAWNQKTKYLWEANIKGWYLEVVHTIPQRPSKEVYTFNIESVFNKHQSSFCYETPEEAQEACEAILVNMLIGLKLYAQDILNDLKT